MPAYRFCHPFICISQIHVDGKNNRQMKFQSNERMKLAKLKTLLYRLPFSLLNQCALSHFILAFVSKLSSKYLNVESNIFESTFSAMLPFNRTRCRSQFSLSVSSVFAVRIRGTTHENDLRSDTNAIKIKSRARIVAREIDKQAQRHTHTHTQTLGYSTGIMALVWPRIPTLYPIHTFSFSIWLSHTHKHIHKCHALK